jgi:hypothetical protein
VLKEFVTIVGLGLAFNATAGVYKCTMPDGRLAYQSLPCPSSAKTTRRDDIKQRAEYQPSQEEPAADAAVEASAAAEPAEKPKTWLEKRAEEREAKKAERKADYDKRVNDANQRIEFERLIFKREIGIGMTKDQVLEAWGEPTSTKVKTTEDGIVEELIFKRYIAGSYTGKDEAFLQDGVVKAFTMDDCDSRRCR